MSVMSCSVFDPRVGLTWKTFNRAGLLAERQTGRVAVRDQECKNHIAESGDLVRTGVHGPRYNAGAA